MTDNSDDTIILHRRDAHLESIGRGALTSVSSPRGEEIVFYARVWAQRVQFRATLNADELRIARDLISTGAPITLTLSITPDNVIRATQENLLRGGPRTK